MNFHPVAIIVDPEKPSDIKQDDRLLRIGKLVLFILISISIIGFIISTGINARTIVKLKEELKTKDEIIINEQITNKNYSELNSKLFRENTMFKQTLSK